MERELQAQSEAGRRRFELDLLLRLQGEVARVGGAATPEGAAAISGILLALPETAEFAAVREISRRAGGFIFGDLPTLAQAYPNLGTDNWPTIKSLALNEVSMRLRKAATS